MGKEIKLGVIAKDIITGYEGVVMAISEYYTGCITCGILKQGMIDGKISDWEWIDSKRLKRVGSNIIKFQNYSNAIKDDGGEMECPPQM